LTLQGVTLSVTGNSQFSGLLATLTDPDPRTDPTFYTATITWDDGTKSTGTITGNNPFKIKGTHHFGSFNNEHFVTITVTDLMGQTATVVDRVVDPPAHKAHVKAPTHHATRPRAVRHEAPARFPRYLKHPR